MNTQYPKLEQQGQSPWQQLAGLRELQRGFLTEQFLTVKPDGSVVKHYPYPLWTRMGRTPLWSN